MNPHEHESKQESNLSQGNLPKQDLDLGTLLISVASPLVRARIVHSIFLKDQRMANDEMIRAISECPNLRLKEALIVEFTAHLRKSNQGQLADQILIKAGHILPLVVRLIENDELVQARQVLYGGFSLSREERQGLYRSDLFHLLAELEERAGRFTHAVDAWIETGQLGLAARKASQFNVESRQDLTARLSHVDTPHSFGAAMARIGLDANSTALREELLKSYRALEDNATRDFPLEPKSKKHRDYDKKEAAKRAEFERLSKTFTLEELGDGGALLNELRNGKSLEEFEGLALALADKALSQSNRSAAALIKAQTASSLKGALEIALKPKDKALLKRIGELVIERSEIAIAHDFSNTATYSQGFYDLRLSKELQTISSWLIKDNLNVGQFTQAQIEKRERKDVRARFSLDTSLSSLYLDEWEQGVLNLISTLERNQIADLATRLSLQIGDFERASRTARGEERLLIDRFAKPG